eukprot:8114515-Karenia_brevis.AAC.1
MHCSSQPCCTSCEADRRSSSSFTRVIVGPIPGSLAAMQVPSDTGATSTQKISRRQRKRMNASP